MGMSGMSPKAARLIRGMRQEEVAELLCVHRTTYGELERHPERFTIQQAHQLCRAYRMSMDELFPVKGKR